MDLTININGTDLIGEISGRFSFDDSQRFRELLQRLEEEKGIKQVTLSLGKLEQVDSAALGMFMMLYNAAKQRNIGVTLQNPQGAVQKMFTLSKFDELFNIT